MKRRWNSLVAGGGNVLGLALLALSVMAGGSAARAAGVSVVLGSAAFEPLVKLAGVFQQRVVAKLEAPVAAIADSIVSNRIATQEPCVADGSGARTCITKVQLDALLKGAMRTAQADPAPQAAPNEGPAAAVPAATTPRPSEQAACPEKCVAPEGALAAAPLETPPAGDPPGSATKETATSKEAAAPEAASPAVKETLAPEAASSAAVQPATRPAADQRQVAAQTPGPR